MVATRSRVIPLRLPNRNDSLKHLTMNPTKAIALLPEIRNRVSLSVREGNGEAIIWACVIMAWFLLFRLIVSK